MYVVKVGEYYVLDFNGFEIVLSKERMKSYPLFKANLIAERLNGEVMKMEVTNE